VSDVASIAEAVRNGEVDPAEPAIAAVARLHEQNGGPQGLNAFLAALSNVEASALEVSRDRGRLPGVPIAVKDNMATVGFPTTCGSKILEGYQSPYEATVVRRLREEGAVIADETLSRKAGEGFDALTGKWVDMVKAGIIDPTKVVRSALQNAASIAGLMLTTDTLVTSVKDNEKAVDGAVS